MIIHYTFIFSIILLLVFLFRWAFRALPKEQWQILGVIPAGKRSDGFWQGINVTFYGFFIATAYLFAVMMVYLLMGSLSIPAGVTTAVIISVCSASVPAAKILARVVEKKAHTASVGAASFVGIVLAPWAVLTVKLISGIWTAPSLPVLPTLTALTVAYAFGEGIGRLACISFGCCYGRPMRELPAFFRRIAGFRPLVFTGATKKIAYAGHLEGVEIFPIQPLTAVLYCLAGVVGIHLFLIGQYRTAFLLTLLVTQIWRFLSEFLRADFRGKSKISAYQIMTLIALPYGFLLAAVFPSAADSSASLLKGFATFWNPLLLLFLQVIWTAMFWYSGRSHTTGATLKFHVNQDRI